MAFRTVENLDHSSSKHEQQTKDDLLDSTEAEDRQAFLMKNQWTLQVSCSICNWQQQHQLEMPDSHFMALSFRLRYARSIMTSR